MKVLFLSCKTNNKNMNGGDICNKKNLSVLKKVFGNDNVLKYEVNYYKNKLSVFLHNLFGYSLGYSFFENFKLKKYIQENNIDILFISSSAIGHISKSILKTVKSITFFHNVEYLYSLQLFGKSRISLKKLIRVSCIKRNEQYLCDNSTCIVTLNNRDSKELKRLYGRGHDVLIPILFEDRFNQSKVVPCDIDMLFIGADFFGNTEGLFWFIENCLDKIGSKLTVIGSGMDKYKAKYPEKNVEFLGFVEDLDSYIYRSKCVVLPIISGSGMKTKTCEALMFGKTIFGTDEAFEGYEGIDDCGCVRCNTAEEFINSLKNYLLNNNLRKSEKVREYFKNNFCLDNLTKNISIALNKILENAKIN